MPGRVSGSAIANAAAPTSAETHAAGPAPSPGPGHLLAMKPGGGGWTGGKSGCGGVFSPGTSGGSTFSSASRSSGCAVVLVLVIFASGHVLIGQGYPDTTADAVLRVDD